MARLSDVHANRAIRVVIGSLEVGGAEGHIAQVLPLLRQLGWTPRVITLLGKGPMSDHLMRADVAVYELPSAHRLRRWPKWLRRSLGILYLVRDLRRELRATPGDVTWMLLPHAYLLTMVASLLARHTAPMVMSRRSLNLYQRRYPGLRLLERMFHRRLATVLANSHAVADELINDEGVSTEKLVLIHNGVDLRRFDAAIERAVTRRTLDIPSDVVVLCSVANLLPYKGHEDLLQALAGVCKQLPPWRLICVGSGEHQTLHSIALGLGLEHNIVWLGRRTDVPDLLVASDIGILASHEEGFSNAVLECMAAGLPMITTRVGGNVDAVVDGETGILVTARNSCRLGAAILELVSDPERARQMGNAGRLRVAKCFSQEQCVGEYDRVFTEMCDRMLSAREMRSDARR